MKGYTETLRTDVDALLQEGYRLWEATDLPPLEAEARYAGADAAGAIYSGPQATKFAAACQCFYLFRRLHLQAESFPETAALLGDYFFSRFSAHLIPLDNVPLIRAFSECLARDAAARARTGAGEAADRAGSDARAGDEPEFISAIRKALRT
jgi:hypothetical protein